MIRPADWLEVFVCRCFMCERQFSAYEHVDVCPTCDAYLPSGEALAAEGARASGKASADCAGLRNLPDGNHGENVLQGANRD